MNNADKIKNTEAINNMNKNYRLIHFDFVKHSRIFFIIVAAIFVTGIVSFFVRGFSLDIDFVGGTIMEINIGRDLTVADADDITAQVEQALGSNMVSSVVRSGTPAQQVLIKTKSLTTEQRDAVFQALAAKYNLTAKDIYASNNVNPTVGDSLRNSAIMAVIFAAILMLLFITFRFNFRSGLAAVLSLLFDLYVMLTFYSLFQEKMNTASIAAFLTILGYSINATIILFDRIRENIKLKKGSKFSEIVNVSIAQTFARSVNTTLTVFITLVVLYILGVPSIRNFILPLIIGVVSGLFSSVCLSGPMWSFFKGEGAETVKGKVK